jgi:ELWxxDGT repeat protein
VNGFELWVSDGTDSGTFLMNDIAPGSVSSRPSSYTVLDSALYFLASENGLQIYPSDIYVTNGLSCGTRKVTSHTYNTTSAQSLAVSGSKLFVSLRDSKLGQEPFIVDPSQIPPPPPGCGPAQPEPITQPTALTFSNVVDTSMTVSFTASSNPGAGYLILMRAYESPYPNDAPIDGTVYQVGQVIGSSSVVVSVGPRTSLSIMDLSPETTYYFDVFTYDVDHDYLTENPLAGNQRTGNAQQAPPTSLVFSNVTDNSMTISFTAVDPAPDGYITVMRPNSSPHPADAPQNGTVYHAGSVINGTSIVVGFGSATSFNVIYLSPDTEYFFDVYPFTESAGQYTYTTANPLGGSQRTVGTVTMLSRTEEAPAAYPNPFTDALTIPFETSADNTSVRIVIYDQVGRMIADVVNNTFDTGSHEVRWDRTDTQGNKVQGGLYVYHIRATDNSKVKQGLVVAR